MGGRLLAIECATEACSVALFDGTTFFDGRYEVLGRGHAERLVPMIAELPDRGRAERIFVGLGPGSFTGIRIGLAAARALGLAWGAEVRGYPTLALVAAMARSKRPGPVSVCMSGGHGEWFVQDFDAEGLSEGDILSLRPEAASGAARHDTVAGSQSEALVALRGSGDALPLLPDARHALQLPETVLTPDLAPLYGRPPDAKVKGAA